MPVKDIDYTDQRVRLLKKQTRNSYFKENEGVMSYKRIHIAKNYQSKKGRHPKEGSDIIKSRAWREYKKPLYKNSQW